MSLLFKSFDTYQDYENWFVSSKQLLNMCIENPNTNINNVCKGNNSVTLLLGENWFRTPQEVVACIRKYGNIL